MFPTDHPFRCQDAVGCSRAKRKPFGLPWTFLHNLHTKCKDFKYRKPPVTVILEIQLILPLVFAFLYDSKFPRSLKNNTRYQLFSKTVDAKCLVTKQFLFRANVPPGQRTSLTAGQKNAGSTWVVAKLRAWNKSFLQSFSSVSPCFGAARTTGLWKFLLLNGVERFYSCTDSF